MPGEVAGFTPEPDVHSSKLSRTRCIIICVTLITLLGVCVAIALVFTYSADEPGLIVYPHVFVNLERSQIQNYLDIINSFVDKKDSHYPLGQHYADCSFKHRAQKGEECIFNMLWLSRDCDKRDNWGYRDGNPCILLVFNEPKNWIPEPYTSPNELPHEMPTSLRRHIEEAFTHNNPPELYFLWVTCTGEYPADEEYIGETSLSPWNGIPIYYFPIRQETTLRAIPVLAFKFHNPTHAVLLSVKCEFWAKNLKPPHVAAKFELLI